MNDKKHRPEKTFPEGLHPSHPDYAAPKNPDHGPAIKRDQDIPKAKPTRFYDGFDGFTYPGAKPAENPHVVDQERRKSRGRGR